MRIAMLTQVVPNPPDAGPKIKTHYALRTLAQEHDIELITFVRSKAEAEMAHTLRQWCSAITTIPLERSHIREPYYLARGWSQLTPFLVARDARREFARAVTERITGNRVDVLHADQLSMAQYLNLDRRRHGGPIRRVFDAHNAVWELVQHLAPRQPTPFHRAAADIEWRLLRRFEGRVARESDLTLCVSEHDRSALETAAGTTFRSAVVPIGTEVEERPVMPVQASATSLLSIATMHYPPNAEAVRWFLAEVFPQLARRHPNLRCDIAGSRPPNDIVQWPARDSRVTIHGYVEDLTNLYRNAVMFIVPLLSGSGVRVKILEAMAHGVPVVSTSIGADGLELRHGEQIMIADTSEDFANAISTLVEQPELRHRIAQAARTRVLELYDWRRCCRPILDAYQSFDDLPEAQGLSKPGLSRALPTS